MDRTWATDRRLDDLMEQTDDLLARIRRIETGDPLIAYTKRDLIASLREQYAALCAELRELAR